MINDDLMWLWQAQHSIRENYLHRYLSDVCIVQHAPFEGQGMPESAAVPCSRTQQNSVGVRAPSIPTMSDRMNVACFSI